MHHTAGSSRFGERWSGVPLVATVLVATNALIMTLIAFGNITDFGTNWDFVQGVLGMQTTNFGQEEGVGLDPDVMWHAVPWEPLQMVGYIAIIAAETLAAVLLVVATVKWLRGFAHDEFASARKWSNLGLLMIILVFGVGFTAIGGEWFQMWRSASWNGLEPALRYFIMASFALVFVNMPSERWQKSHSAAPEVTAAE